MTETAAFPFDSSPSPDDEPAAGPDRRRLLLVITIGVIALALVGYLLATQVFGGKDQVASSLVDNGVTPAPAASGTPAPTPQPTPESVRTAVHNPFVPLVSVPVTGTAAAPAPAPSAAAAPAATTPSTPGMTTFRLLSVSGTQSLASIDGVSYPASVGQAFAGTYKLTATSGGACAAFTNAGKKFSLCEGQTLLF